MGEAEVKEQAKNGKSGEREEGRRGDRVKKREERS